MLLALLTSACSKRYQDLPTFMPFLPRDVQNDSVGRFKTSYLADQIYAYYNGNLSGPIVVTTFVDVNNLYETSSFGRILSEQLISELSMRGFNVIELRLAEALQIMHDKGEFGLSRDTATLKREHKISTIVTGTYASSPDRVYLNVRLIDPKTSFITSVGSVEMSKSEEIARLMRTTVSPQVLERIPVRHLGYGRSPELHYRLFEPNSNWAPDEEEFGVEEKRPAVIKPELGLKQNSPAQVLPQAKELEPTS